MINTTTIENLVAEKLEGTDSYIVDVMIRPSNQIIVEMDSPNGVLLTDCIVVSKHIEANLDREVEDFALEVSSPNLSKPFKILRQYEKYTGSNVKVIKTDGVKLEGELLQTNPEFITLKTESKERVEGKKKKIIVAREWEIPFTEIKETVLIISFK